MNNNLKISVNQLLEIFRGAIISIIPWLEKAKIEWQSGKSYDDWDNIAIALYQNIICNSLTGEVLSQYSIAKYDFHYSDYSQLDYILVHSNEHMNKKLAFVSFLSISTPLDFVEVAILDDFEKVLEYINLSNNNLEFIFIKLTNGIKKKIIEVNIIV